jgi:hypothetical protein
VDLLNEDAQAIVEHLFVDGGLYGSLFGNGHPEIIGLRAQPSGLRAGPVRRAQA